MRQLSFSAYKQSGIRRAGGVSPLCFHSFKRGAIPIEPKAQTPAPNRKRRRWLVATAIAFVAFVWWLRPQADPRFVGRWAAYNNTSSFTPVCIIELRSNGRGHTVFSDNSAPDDFFWSVEDGEFRTGLADGVWQTIFRQFFARLWMKLSGTPFILGVHGLRVDRVDENEIKLIDPDDGDEIIYRRVE